VIAGGEKRVTVASRETKKAVWSAAVDGAAHGLAVAHGRLYVSTDKGSLYCFDAGDTKTPTIHAFAAEKAVYGQNDAARATADAILKQAGVNEGYCAHYHLNKSGGTLMPHSLSFP
jgi:outer membrane protein assembly factor BamB